VRFLSRYACGLITGFFLSFLIRLWFDQLGMMCNSFQNANRIRQAYNVVIKAPRRVAKMEVYLFYGPSGTGKSQFARDQADAAGYDPYVLPIGKDFWLTPTMCGKKYVIIDDFKSNLGLKDFLNLLDKYPVEAPTKGIVSLKRQFGGVFNTFRRIYMVVS